MTLIPVLMLAPFTFTTSAFVFAGVLEPMAADLGVTVATAGQLQTAFALSCAVGGPILANATVRLPKKALLVAVLSFVALAHAACAVASSYGVVMALRIVAGFVGALAFPLATALAVGAVPLERRGTAIAIVFGGISMAFLFGIPMGSVFGGLFDWRASFWWGCAIAGLAALAIGLFGPAEADAPPPPRGAFRAIMRWPLTGYLSITFLAFCATFTTVAYIGPIVTRLTGFTGGGVGAVQVCSGVGGIIGLTIGARLARRNGPVISVLLFGTICAQLLFSLGMLLRVPEAVGIPLAFLATLSGSAALFTMNPIIQTRIAGLAGAAATIAFAVNGSMVYFGQGAGAGIGGLVEITVGLPYAGAAGAAVGGLGSLLAYRLSRSDTADAAVVQAGAR